VKWFYHICFFATKPLSRYQKFIKTSLFSVNHLLLKIYQKNKWRHTTSASVWIEQYAYITGSSLDSYYGRKLVFIYSKYGNRDVFYKLIVQDLVVITKRKRKMDYVFFSFPKDSNLRKVWTHYCKRSNFVPGPSHRLCSAHLYSKYGNRDVFYKLLIPTKRFSCKKTDMIKSFH
jgi:hypothetical protein